MSLVLNCKPVMNIPFNLQTTFRLVMLSKYNSQLFNFHLHGSLVLKVLEEKQLGGGILFLPG